MNTLVVGQIKLDKYQKRLNEIYGLPETGANSPIIF
jgi:hypothetical protein